MKTPAPSSPPELRLRLIRRPWTFLRRGGELSEREQSRRESGKREREERWGRWRVGPMKVFVRFTMPHVIIGAYDAVFKTDYLGWASR